MSKFAKALMGDGGAAGVPQGPVVRVARGNNVTVRSGGSSLR